MEASPVFAFSLENGPEVHQAEESWPKLNYSNVTLLPTLVIPTPLVQEYKTATEGCKKNLHAYALYTWATMRQRGPAIVCPEYSTRSINTLKLTMDTGCGILHGRQGWSAGQGSQQMLILELSHP